LLLGGRALREKALDAAGRIAAATGARLLCEVFPTRLQRGAGRVAPRRLPYFAEAAMEALQDPGKPGWLAPEGCEISTLATVDEDPLAALTAVADRIGARGEAELVAAAPEVPAPAGPLTPVAIGQSLVRTMPQDAIVVDEAATCGMGIFPATLQARRHDWLTLTGGAIGYGLPAALGAAIACPNRKVVSLQADGSVMYTVQALWSMAREQADVTVVILNNRSYAILNIELARVGAGQPTPATMSMLDLSRPDLDFVALAQGLGVAATRATTAEEFDAQLAGAMGRPGPRLIEAMVVQQMP
jgi:acetolactate synthase-1/2/3 large subunit